MVALHAAGGCPVILAVEDEFLIALWLQSGLEDAGFRVLGPAPSVETALHYIGTERPHAAVLDVELGRETSVRVAEMLVELGVPFVVSSGLGSEKVDLYPVLKGHPLIDKPADLAKLIGALVSLIGANGPPV